MANQAQKLLLLVLFFYFACFSNAYQFSVGGRDGWRPSPSESYNHWAERMRFQVNDTLVFKFNKGSDAVLVVNKDDYDKCNTQNPIQRMEDGNSVFKFERSGPFYFITNNTANCTNAGQKLFIIVMAVRNNRQSLTPSVAPSPSSTSPSPVPSPSPSETDGPSADHSLTPSGVPENLPHHSSAKASWDLHSVVFVSAISFVLSNVVVHH